MTDDRPTLEALTTRWGQLADSCQSGDADQLLIVEMADAGGGPYCVLRTTRWAVDCAEDLARLLRRVEQMIDPGQAEADTHTEPKVRQRGKKGRGA